MLRVDFSLHLLSLNLSCSLSVLCFSYLWSRKEAGRSDCLLTTTWVNARLEEMQDKLNFMAIFVAQARHPALRMVSGERKQER